LPAARLSGAVPERHYLAVGRGVRGSTKQASRANAAPELIEG